MLSVELYQSLHHVIIGLYYMDLELLQGRNSYFI